MSSGYFVSEPGLTGSKAGEPKIDTPTEEKAPARKRGKVLHVGDEIEDLDDISLSLPPGSSAYY